MRNSTLDQISQVLSTTKAVGLTSHVLPDGDSIGSLLALERALKKLGAKTEILLADPVPQSYQFLLGLDDLATKVGGEIPDTLPELIVVLDCTDLSRVGEKIAAKIVGKTLINIDHHISNQWFGTFNWVMPEAVATGEMVYSLIVLLGVAIDKAIATALFTAITTDSGSFRYDNTRPQSLQVGASLLEAGADLAAIREQLWENKSVISMELLAKALATLSLTDDGRVAWVALPARILKELGADGEHCEGFVDYPKSIKGVEIGIFFRETDNSTIKVGFRSKRYADVNRLAAMFGGGGHPRAAGCTVQGSLPTVIEQVTVAAQKLLDEGINHERHRES